MVAAKLQESLGQTVIVDNRSGANGMIGSSLVAHAAPDGYTLLAATPASHVTAVHLMKNLPVDPVKDFTPMHGGGRAGDGAGASTPTCRSIRCRS